MFPQHRVSVERPRSNAGLFPFLGDVRLETFGFPRRRTGVIFARVARRIFRP